MTARDIPPDDLYARLELLAGAAPEAIEIAWRALLKRHHPDVAGEASLDQDHLWATIQAPRGTSSDLAPYAAVTDNAVYQYNNPSGEGDGDHHGGGA